MKRKVFRRRIITFHVSRELLAGALICKDRSIQGVAYAFASLSCTLPIFLAVIGASLTTAGVAGGLTMFGAYAAGMASALMAIALSMALLKGAVAQKFRLLLPYLLPISHLSRLCLRMNSQADSSSRLKADSKRHLSQRIDIYLPRFLGRKPCCQRMDNE